MVALDVVIIIVVGLLALLVAGLLRSNAEITRSLHQMGVDLSPDGAGGGVTTPVAISRPAGGARPTPGRPAATDLIDLAGVNPAGEAMSIAITEVRHDTLIAFLTSGCSTCKVIWEALRTGVADVPGGARLVAVTRGPDGESPAAVGELAGTTTPVVMSTETWQHYDVPYAPYFVYVSGPEGRVTGEGVASSWDQVQGLLATAVADGAANPMPAVDVDRQWAIAGADADRAERIDRELSAAGIRPGDPRLHHHGSLQDPATTDDRES